MNYEKYGFIDIDILIESYIERASFYQKIYQSNLMCEDLKRACNLGDCKAFNKHCN